MPGSENSNIFHYVYVLKSLNKNFLYVGFSHNIKKRLDEHNGKLVISTKSYAPFDLIYYEACRNLKDALRREKYLKTSQGARLLKRRLKEYFYSI